jgi:hypothetical protein
VSQVPTAPGPPCVTCQELSLTADQAGLIPAALKGTRVLVRVTAADRATAWTRAIETIRSRGGLPGVHVVGVPAPEDPAVSGFGDQLLIEVAPGDPDQLAFGLKRALTAARGRSARATLLIAADAGLVNALRDRGLASYVDGFIAVPGTIARPEDVLTPSAEPVRVWRLPADAGLAWDTLLTSAALQ